MSSEWDSLGGEKKEYGPQSYEMGRGLSRSAGIHGEQLDFLFQSKRADGSEYNFVAEKKKRRGSRTKFQRQKRPSPNKEGCSNVEGEWLHEGQEGMAEKGEGKRVREHLQGGAVRPKENLRGIGGVF